MLCFTFRFRAITKSYLRRVDGVLLMYDITRESSFRNIRDWIQSIEVCTIFKGLDTGGGSAQFMGQSPVLRTLGSLPTMNHFGSFTALQPCSTLHLHYVLHVVYSLLILK